ncbi:P-hydroxybenzoic acid efflux pump [Salix suchowensis]|nr:P-hydroxybenzoic acid efflux pump [Salix suchowensis]
MLATTDRARAVWQRCLASAFRTALACTIVGCTTLHGPAAVQHHIAFPAFSYVTVILIGTDATLGDALHGCWLALYATVQSVGPALPRLWLIGPARLTNGTISLAVALGAFVVAFPEGTHLIAKRIALGQIVIMYVVAFINGVDTHDQAIMHSLNVAASTAIGVLACAIALLLPYPRLACWELKQNCGRLAENVSERLELYVKAFCAEDNALALSYISQAKPLTIAGAKLLSSIKRYQESVKWERLPLRYLRNSYLNLGERLQELEIPLRGMEMALSTTSSFPIRMLDAETKQVLAQQEEHVILTLKQIKHCLPRDSSTVLESNVDKIIESLQTLHATTPTNHEDLPTFFLLFCMKLLHCRSLAKPITSIHQKDSSTPCEKNGFFKSTWMSNWSTSVNRKRLKPAFKCSLSLGLAILFGLIYNKNYSCWSGLLVAISIAAAREATSFKAANVRAQGTVLGTVYGVFGCFVFERYLPLRFISLLPWFVVTSFLRRSQMYGQAGGISAVIGALLLLGRKDFGLPSEFAIARIVETFIGLSCSIMVDLILQPTRSSSLAKVQLSKCFGTLSACVSSMNLAANNKTILLEKQRKLKLDVSELGKFIGEAEVEPNFWFLPFNTACYCTLLGSLSKVVDLLLFSADALGLLEQESQKLGASWKESVNKLNGDVELFKGMAGSLVECFEDVTLLKSLTFLEKQLENKNISYDLELGKSSNLNIFKASGLKDDKIDSIINSYLQHSKEIVDKFQAADHEGGRELKSQVVLCLSALGFCMSNLIKETREIEKGIIELLQWENPLKHINLYEISCKTQSLYN